MADEFCRHLRRDRVGLFLASSGGQARMIGQARQPHGGSCGAWPVRDSFTPHIMIKIDYLRFVLLFPVRMSEFIHEDRLENMSAVDVSSHILTAWF